MLYPFPPSTFSLTGTFAGNGNNLTIVGAITNNGTFRFQGGETITLTAGMDTTSGTVTYLGDNSVAATYTGLPAGNSYYNLTFTSEITNDVFEPSGALDVDGSLSISADTTLQSGGNDFTVAGDFSNDGTFTHANNTVTLDGTGTQTVNGTSTFYNLTATASSARTLVLEDGQATIVTNALTLTGGSGSILTFESGSAGSVATLNASAATVTVNHLSVKDITSAGGTILCDTGCINRGNNAGWTIPAEAPAELSGPSSARIMQPNGSEQWTVGETYDVTWSMVHDDLDTVTIQISDDGGTTWVTVAEGLENSGVYALTVPNLPSKKALVRVVGYDAQGSSRISDNSDRTFAINMSNEESSEEEAGEEVSEQETDFADVVMTDVEGNEVTLMPGGLFRGETLSGVYYVHEDGTRSVFPNATVFESHGFSFDDVVMVQDDQLQKLDLGRRMTMAPGRLVKIQSDSRVFEIGTDGLLHHVTSEAQAVERYGDTWNQQITDISVVFWGDYLMGEAL